MIAQLINRENKLKQLSNQFHRGFSLLELLVVIVIVGILVAVALPSYTESVNKGRRSDAMSALLDAANRQEQFMLDRNTYTTTIGAGGLGMSTTSAEGHYNITAAAGPTGSIVTSYLLTATPDSNSPQNDDTRCTQFTLNSTGTKAATGTHPNQCWGL